MPKLAIIHTTPSTIEPLKQLAAEFLPGWSVINFVDDSILPQLLENQGNVAEVQERLLSYAIFAEQAGADLLLEACSSVGELVPLMRQRLQIPVVRIDEAMAETAVASAVRISVAATLPTTLGPTSRLLDEKAKTIGKEIHLTPKLIEGAFDALRAGDSARHDVLVADELLNLAAESDLVVLAQASMARVVASLPASVQMKFIASPRLAMEQVRAAAHGAGCCD